MSVTINSESTDKFSLKQREAKTIQFSYDVSLTGVTLSLLFTDVSDTVVISKSDSDFDKSDSSNGNVTVNLTTEDLDLEVGTYYGELRAIFTSLTEVDKTETFKMKIRKSIHED